MNSESSNISMLTEVYIVSSLEINKQMGHR